MTHSTKIEIVPSGAALGAEIRGVDLENGLDDAVFDAIYAAWLEHLVLRFRRQALSDEALLAFSRRFGELDRAPVNPYGRTWVPEHPEINVISNITRNGEPLGGLGHYEAKWHADMTYNEHPPKANVLYAVEVPEKGGDTGFANMYLAYETLPEELKEKIAGLRCKHDASRNSVGQLRKGYKESYEDPRDIPGAVHPLVRVHPETGRPALFLGRRRNAWIVDLPLDESDALLDRLWAHATRPEFAWYQQWQVGDLVIWDNRCTLHRREAFDPKARRLMRRTQIGDRDPVLGLAA